MEITFFVGGIPKPGGSKSVYINPKTGKPCVTDACKDNKAWRRQVELTIAATGYKNRHLEGPLRVEVGFHMPRPMSHYRTGKNVSVLKTDAPNWHASPPDLTKLWRAAEDACTDAGLWLDDAQVVQQTIKKTYGSYPGMKITVSDDLSD